MTEIPPILTRMSATALAIALSQTVCLGTVLAAESPSAPEATASQATTPAAETTPQETTSTHSPAEASRTKAAERRAARETEREKRYAELRESAAQLGVDLPETPPWKTSQSMANPPRPSDRPSHSRKTPEELEAMRQRQWAARESHWKKRREEAAEHGMEMPSAPSWEEMEQRRQEMAQRFEQYRKTVEQMTDEQREAARAVFGRPMGMPMARMPQAPGHGYRGWDQPYRGEGHGMPYPGMMPRYYDGPGYDQGPPPPPDSSSGGN